MRREDAPRLAGPAASTLARWPGECVACGRDIARGEVIARDRGVWIHESCAAARQIHRPLATDFKTSPASVGEGEAGSSTAPPTTARRRAATLAAPAAAHKPPRKETPSDDRP
jgi:hypothetical protein